MSSFCLGLLVGRLLWGRREQSTEPKVRFKVDPEETYRCGRCNAEVHWSAKRCTKCGAHLNDETKMVEMTYTWGQIVGYIVTAAITAVLAFAILHYVFGWV